MMVLKRGDTVLFSHKESKSYDLVQSGHKLPGCTEHCDHAVRLHCIV